MASIRSRRAHRPPQPRTHTPRRRRALPTFVAALAAAFVLGLLPARPSPLRAEDCTGDDELCSVTTTLYCFGASFLSFFCRPITLKAYYPRPELVTE